MGESQSLGACLLGTAYAGERVYIFVTACAESLKPTQLETFDELQAIDHFSHTH